MSGPHRVRGRWPAIVWAALLCLLGCGAASDAIPVSGRVTFGGKPLEMGALTFFPPVGRPITAVIDSHGDYESQLPPGDYQVTILVGVRLPPDWKEGDPVPRQQVRLPVQYASRKQTPLTARVQPGQSEPIDFALGNSTPR